MLRKIRVALSCAGRLNRTRYRTESVYSDLSTGRAERCRGVKFANKVESIFHSAIKFSNSGNAAVFISWEVK
jgi:hypothetical protein